MRTHIKINYVIWWAGNPLKIKTPFFVRSYFLFHFLWEGSEKFYLQISAENALGRIMIPKFYQQP